MLQWKRERERPRKRERKSLIDELEHPEQELLEEPQETPDTGGASASTGDAPAIRQPYQPIPRTDEPTLQEMTNAPSRPLDKALVQDMVGWCEDISFGHTKFLNIHRDCGEDAVMGPPELTKRIGTCWNAEVRFELIFAQIIRTPAARRLARPYVEPEVCPWRKTILITMRGS